VWSEQARGRFDRLGNRLDRFAAPDGTLIYDTHSAPRPDPDVVAPPRFLPYYENLVLGLRDRSRVLGPRVPQFPSNTFVRFVLIDGKLGATWALRRSKRQVTLRVEPFVSVSGDDRSGIREEGARLLDSFESESASTSVDIAEATN
jgi:Winged helix DNA-binding domain